MFINIDDNIINSKHIKRISKPYHSEEIYYLDICIIDSIPVTICGTKDEMELKRSKLKTLLNVKEL